MTGRPRKPFVSEKVERRRKQWRDYRRSLRLGRKIVRDVRMTRKSLDELAYPTGPASPNWKTT